MFNVRVENVGGQVILHCEGRLVRGDDTRLLCTALRQDIQEIMVDLNGVTAVDAAGVGALISLQAAGFYLTLVDPTPTVREVLRRTNLDSIFEIVEAGSALGNTEAAAHPAAVYG